MTVYDGAVPGAREYLFMRLAMLAKGRQSRRASIEGNRVPAEAYVFVRIMLHLAGFALLTFAGFQWNIIAGLIVAGISCFVLSTLMSGTNSDENGRG